MIRPVAWWPKDEWITMWRGDICAMCTDAAEPHNEYGSLIAETGSSFVRLARNQTQPGYCVVIAKRHAPELHHLTSDERVGFWEDVSTIGEAITNLLQPVKLAQLSMGFRIPHFHCHVYPQYLCDDPCRLLDPQDGDVRLAPEAWEERLRLIRQEFDVLRRRAA
jgi:diadenosine tetraphosphate (Ap4A) HIT family hydrolase